MAITFIDFASNNADAASSTAVDVSGIGIQENDVLIFFGSCDNDASSTGFDQPSGFTEIQPHTETSGSHSNIAGYKVADGTETSITVNVAGAASERGYAIIACYRGVDPADPIQKSNHNEGGSDQTGVITSITPDTDNCAVLCFVGTERGNAGAAFVSSWPSTISERDDNSNGPPGTGAASSAGAFGDVIQTSAAAVSGNIDLSGLTGGNTNWGTFAVVLNPLTLSPGLGGLDIEWVNSASNGAANGADFSVTLPSMQQLDVVVVTLFGYDSGAEEVTISSSGWTKAAEYYSSSIKLEISYKVMGETPDSSVAINGSTNASDAASAIAQVFRNVDVEQVLDQASPDPSLAGSGNPDSPSITTLTDGAWVCSCVGSFGALSGPSAPSGYSNDDTLQTTDSFNSSIGAASKLVATAGAENPGAWSGFASATNIAATIALRPSTIIRVIGTAGNAAANGADFSITIPGDVQEGDLVLVYTHLCDTTNAVDGYTKISSVPIYYKFMGATPDTTVDVTGLGNSLAANSAVCAVVRGVDASVLDATTTADGGTGAPPDSPSITTQTDGALVVSFGGSQVNDASVTEPTDYLNPASATASDTVSSTAAVATRRIDSAGAEDPGAWSDWTNGTWNAYSVALKPQGPAGAIIWKPHPLQHILVR